MDAAVTSAVTQNSCAKWARYDAGVKQATTAWVCAAGLVVVIAGCGDGAATDTDGTDDVPAPDAAEVTCPPIVDPAGGSYESGCGGDDGARCELTCDVAGFTSSEPGGATCTAGDWSQPTCVFDLDLDDDGVRRYPWGPDLDDDGDGATTIALGGTDLDDANPARQETTGTGAFVAGATITLTAGAGTTDLTTGAMTSSGQPTTDSGTPTTSDSSPGTDSAGTDSAGTTNAATSGTTTAANTTTTDPSSTTSDTTVGD